MIYIALGFLEGILIIYNRPLAYVLAGLLLLIIIKRKPPLILTVALLCQPIISYEIFSIHNNTKTKEIDWFRITKHFKQRIDISTLQIKQGKYAETSVSIHNKEVKLFYFPKNPTELSQLSNLSANMNCFVEGQFKVDPDFNNAISLMVKRLDIKSCKQTSSSSIQSVIEKHKAYSLMRLKEHSPFWQNTYAMITGDVSYINPSAVELDKDLGIYHLLAVSSSHVVVIASMFYFVFNRLSVPLVIVKSFIIFVLFLFAYYTNFAPSALRAILCMTLVMILPKKCYKSLLDILSLVFLFLTLSNPDIVLDIGFQFSFLITFFILLCAPALNNLSTFKSMCVLTLIAQIGSFLISAFHFNQIQWIGFLANFIFIPFYSAVLFPVAIFTYFFYQFFNTNFLLNMIISKLYAVHDQLLIPIFKNFVKIRWFVGEMNNILLASTLIWLIILLIFTSNRKFKTCFVVFILGSIVITIITSIPHTRFTALNVGQGDSFLFETGNRKRILIDTGGKAQNENQTFNFGADNHNSHSISKFHVLPTLRKRGITALDYVIITHPHADHIGELDYIMSHVHIKKLIVNFKSYPNALLFQLNSLCHQNDTKLIDVNTIQSIGLGNDKITFLDTAITTSKDLNDHSIMALIQTKKFNILTTGDATTKNEQRLMERYQLPKIDILKVGHHGSHTSNGAEYIKQIHPTYSVIGSGKNNVYKLPNKEVMNRLKQVHSKIYNTQTNGEITFNLDHQIDVNVQHE